MSEPLIISVIIPTYNRADLLVRAVASVLNQTYQVHEVVVCDDGSTDDSRERINALMEPKVRWIDCGRSGGPAIPRNIGIKQSTGNWIAFLDSDDEWIPTKIEEQVNLIRDTQSLVICTNATRMLNGVESGKYLNYPKKVIRIWDLLSKNAVILSSLMISREVLNRTPFFPENERFKTIEDYVLWLKIATFTQIYFINKQLVMYSDRPASSHRSASTSDFYDQRKLATTELLSWSKANNIRLEVMIKGFIFLTNSWIIKQKYYFFKLFRDVV